MKRGASPQFSRKKIPANVMLTLCTGLVWVLFSIIFEKNADLKLVTRETADLASVISGIITLFSKPLIPLLIDDR